MRRRRQHEARSAADRDLHRQVGIAEAAVQRALDVCGRAARALGREDGASYRQGQDRLRVVEQHLAAIGHLEDAPSPVDLREEARELVRWLDSRERAAGVNRPARRGPEYQDRLRSARTLLAALDPGAAPRVEEKATPVSPGPLSALVPDAPGVMTDG